MNDVLQLIGKMNTKRKASSTLGPARIPTGSSLTAEKIACLARELESTIAFWKADNLGITPLVRVTYISTVAKSNRLSKLLLDKGGDINSQVVGAEFTDEADPRHVITYRVSKEAMEKSLGLMQEAMRVVEQHFDGKITSEDVDAVNKGTRRIHSKTLSKSSFTQVLKDCYYVSSFSVKEAYDSVSDSQLISIYDTGLRYDELIARLGHNFRPLDRFDDFTWLVSPEQFNMINSMAPYLVSMSVKDLSSTPPTSPGSQITGDMKIPDPTDEPTIGVIDTLFDTSVYFSKWVDYHQELPDELIENSDYRHGTEVTSIIVDGPTLNNALDDGCGRFRVRHFGVSKDTHTSSLGIMRQIKRIVQKNKDIKVWNLSLGSDISISQNFMSPEGAILDQLQYEHDCIFIVAGTNNRSGDHSYPPIGSPADSLNAITVNASDYGDRPVSYTRRGPVLRFFNKPDVSTFAGVNEDLIHVYGPNGLRKTQGTSYAAPWIARKIAYLIHIMGLTKEAAKALIIDSAARWNTNLKKITLIGYGTVPQRIEDIIRTPDDEIRFIISSTVQGYETYSSDIPIPTTAKGCPFRFRVTMCYTPRCHRNQGVDYTDTDLDLHFGRYEGTKMHSIDNNEQGEPIFLNLPEGKARSKFRKWDNVKHITEGLIDNPRHKKMKGSQGWRLSVRTVERLTDKPGQNMGFSAVVTMKSIDKVNRYDIFCQLCASAHIWTAIPLTQSVMLENYHEAEAEMEFES